MQLLLPPLDQNNTWEFPGNEKEEDREDLQLTCARAGQPRGAVPSAFWL